MGVQPMVELREYARERLSGARRAARPRGRSSSRSYPAHKVS
ncbi:hypothetical protein [Streptomyces sp. NPDC057052]